MIDMQYGQMKELLKALVQTWGSEFDANLIEPIIQHVSLPQVARLFPWKKLIKPYSQTTTADTLTYAMPYDFDKFNNRPKTKYGFLTELTPGDFHERFPDRSERKAQDFGCYCIEEYEGVQTQISTAELVTVESSNTGDTQTILIRGEVGGYDDWEELTLNGTTAVSSTKTFSHISYVTKSGVTLGFVTVKGATSGTTFTVIPTDHLTSQYKRMLLDSNPQEALTITGEYYTLAFKPVKDYDVFRVPADLVLLNALALLGWERRDVTNQISIEKKYQTEAGLAIKQERKSYSIDSKMELRNENRKNLAEDNPLRD